MSERKQGKSGREPEENNSNEPRDWSGSGRMAEPEIRVLDRILGGLPFPATKEALAARLAMDAFDHGGGRAAELHDLVVQLEDRIFRNLDELHRAIRERHAWERSHTPA